MEYRHLRFFIAVAEELNFTRAAARLRVAQPHLSREIRRLERELGLPLFARDRRVTLSAAGNAFLAQARRVLDDTVEAVRTAQRASRGESGRIRVGFSSAAGFGLVPDAVRRFRLERPEVELVLTELDSDEQPELLHSLDLDACLLCPPRRAEPGLKTHILMVDRLMAALPEDHLLARRRKVTLAALAAEPWILFRRAVASRLHDEIVGACAKAGFAPRLVQETIELSTTMSLVAGGLGVSLVPLTLTRLRLPRLVYRPLAGAPARVPLAVMWRGSDTNPSLPRFLDTVRREARRLKASGGREMPAERPVRGPVMIANSHPERGR